SLERGHGGDQGSRSALHKKSAGVTPSLATLLPCEKRNLPLVRRRGGRSRPTLCAKPSLVKEGSSLRQSLSLPRRPPDDLVRRQTRIEHFPGRLDSRHRQFGRVNESELNQH